MIPKESLKNPWKIIRSAWNLLKSPQDRLKLLELIRIPKDPQRIPEESLEDHQKPLELELELVEIPHRIIWLLAFIRISEDPQRIPKESLKNPWRIIRSLWNLCGNAQDPSQDHLKLLGLIRISEEYPKIPKKNPWRILRGSSETSGTWNASELPPAAGSSEGF